MRYSGDFFRQMVASILFGVGLVVYGQSPLLEVNPSAVGLWVGEVTISEVAHVTGGTNAPVVDAAQMRILLHVDSAGMVSLLKQVIVAAKAVPSGSLPEGAVVLVGNPARLPSIPGLARPNRRLLAQRIGTAAYDFPGHALRFEGGIGTGFRCQGTLSLGESFSGNPFLHRFHPDHSKGLAIVRLISLSFVVPEGSANGVRRLSGQYEETISGLHKAPIQIRGSVVIHRISPVGVLVQ